MKKRGFTGRESLPMDFKKLTIDDQCLVLSTIKELVAKAKKSDASALTKENKDVIVIPLQLLSSALDKDYERYDGNVTFEKIVSAIKRIENKLRALQGFQEIYLIRAGKVARTSNPNKKSAKSHLRSVLKPHGSNAGSELLWTGTD